MECMIRVLSGNRSFETVTGQVVRFQVNVDVISSVVRSNSQNVSHVLLRLILAT